MTAELWLVKPCPTHRDHEDCLMTRPEARCVGASRVRLNPEQHLEIDVFSGVVSLEVQDIIDALTDTNGTIVSFTQETDQEETQ